MKKENLTLFIPITNLSGIWQGNFKSLPPNKVFELIIRYPLEKPASFKIHAGPSGMTLFGLLKKIGKAYEHIYDNENKYGIWGHDIYDLSLEGISINHKTKKITIEVGS